MDLMTILTAIGFPAAGGAIALAGKWILAGQKDIKDDISKLDTTMDTRVKAIEADTKTFMSRTDLQREFEHEKAGRKTIQQAMDRDHAKVVEDIVNLRCEVARLDQNDTNLTAQYHDLKASVKEGFAKTDHKLDKLCDQMSEMAKKV